MAVFPNQSFSHNSAETITTSDKTLSSSRNHNYALENLEFIRELNALLFLDRIKKEKRERERGKKKKTTLIPRRHAVPKL